MKLIWDYFHTPAFARIVLRYLSGLLMSFGFFGDSTLLAIVGDPDIVGFVSVVIGGALGAASEIAYGIAIKRGWRT